MELLFAKLYQRQLTNCMDRIDGQMAHMLVDSSDSSLFTILDVCIRCARAGDDCSTQPLRQSRDEFSPLWTGTCGRATVAGAEYGFQGSLVGRVFWERKVAA